MTTEATGTAGGSCDHSAEHASGVKKAFFGRKIGQLWKLVVPLIMELGEKRDMVLKEQPFYFLDLVSNRL